MRSFVKTKLSRIGKITLSFADIGKSRPCRELSTSQICVLTLFAKIKFSQKFSNLQYIHTLCMRDAKAMGGLRVCTEPCSQCDKNQNLQCCHILYFCGFHDNGITNECPL